MDIKKRLRPKGKKTIEIIKERVKGGEVLSDALIDAATDEAYELDGDRKLIRTIAGRNMKSAAFLAELELDSPDTKKTIREALLMGIEGTHPLFPKDKEVYLTSLRLAAKFAFVEKIEHTVHEGDFANRSAEELDFYAANGGKWPEEMKSKGSEHIQ